MRILLDESLPIELRSEISSHDVRYVREMGWSGLKNGELLARAAASFEVATSAGTATRSIRVCSGTGAGPTKQYYFDRPAVTGADDRGGAMALFAAMEMYELRHAR